MFLSILDENAPLKKKLIRTNHAQYATNTDMVIKTVTTSLWKSEMPVSIVVVH